MRTLTLRDLLLQPVTTKLSHSQMSHVSKMSLIVLHPGLHSTESLQISLSIKIPVIKSLNTQTASEQKATKQTVCAAQTNKSAMYKKWRMCQPLTCSQILSTITTVTVQAKYFRFTKTTLAKLNVKQETCPLVIDF